MDALWSFVLAHSVVLASLGVAILDFAIALFPGLDGNGLLHQLYLWLKSLAGKS